MKQLPICSMQPVVVVLEEVAGSPKYQDLLSVEDVARRSSTSSKVNGRDMSGHPQEWLLLSSGTNCFPTQMKTLGLPYTGLTVRGCPPSPWLTEIKKLALVRQSNNVNMLALMK